MFRILGPLEIVSADGAVVIGGGKRRGLLAYLLVHRGTIVSLDRIVDELWDGRPSAGASGTVRTYVSQLRKLLPPDCAIESRAGGYRLTIPADALDADRYEHLITSALGRADPHERVQLLDEACSLWTADPLEEFAGSQWADAERARLEGVRLGATSARFDALLELGRDATVIAEIQSVARANPFDERLAAQLMLACYRAGRQADALRVFQDVRSALLEQLGIEPGPDLRELERRILDHDPTLAGPPTAPPVDPPTAQPSPQPSPAVGSPRRRRHRRTIVTAALLLAVIASAWIATTDRTPGTRQNGDLDQAARRSSARRPAFRVVDENGKPFPEGSAGIQACPSEGYSVPCTALQRGVADEDGWAQLPTLDPETEYHFDAFVTNNLGDRDGWSCDFWENPHDGSRWWFSEQVVATPADGAKTYEIAAPGPCGGVDLWVMVYHLDGRRGPLHPGHGHVQACTGPAACVVGAVDVNGHAHLELDPDVTYAFQGAAVDMPGWECPAYVDPGARRFWWSTEYLTSTSGRINGQTFHVSEPDPASCAR